VHQDAGVGQSPTDQFDVNAPNPEVRKGFKIRCFSMETTRPEVPPITPGRRHTRGDLDWHFGDRSRASEKHRDRFEGVRQ
jgi:hypothetical protein